MATSCPPSPGSESPPRAAGLGNAPKLPQPGTTAPWVPGVGAGSTVEPCPRVPMSLTGRVLVTARPWGGLLGPSCSPLLGPTLPRVGVPQEPPAPVVYPRPRLSQWPGVFVFNVLPFQFLIKPPVFVSCGLRAWGPHPLPVGDTMGWQRVAPCQQGPRVHQVSPQPCVWPRGRTPNSPGWIQPNSAPGHWGPSSASTTAAPSALAQHQNQDPWGISEPLLARGHRWHGDTAGIASGLGRALCIVQRRRRVASSLLSPGSPSPAPKPRPGALPLPPPG